jgi:hypothetical protein
VPTFDEVAALVREQTAYSGPLTEATTLQSDIGVYGDDMVALLAAYSARFGVDLSGYLWYFHKGEEGFNIGGLFFPPPNARVQEIPITVGMLHRFSELGRWALEYPPHQPQRYRPDLWVNLLLVLAVLGGLLVFGIRSCVP